MIGVQFYLMDFVDGVVHRHVGLPDVPRERRESIYASAIDNLVAIHRSDINALGLRDFGRPDFERQLHRWTQQYRIAIPESNVEMEQLIDNLQSALPQGPYPTVLLHGDARLDNLMFDRDSDRVLAVLDWELSALGHPLADLGQFLSVQELPSDYLLPGLAGIDRVAEGLPDQAQIASRYLRAMNIDLNVDLRFYKAFAMFRHAAMAAGLRRRAELGTAVSQSALLFGATVHIFARVRLNILGGPR